MAQRRMFSPDIVCSEEFIEMPPSSRELYFQLGMRADDDGFIQPKSVIRSIGAKEDDLRVLVAKRFVLPFDNGVVVVKHWLIHNMIRADRYKPTRFQEEKNTLYIKDDKSYTDNPDNGIPLLATKWQPNGNHPAPQVRLGKDSIDSEPLRARGFEIVEGFEEDPEENVSRARILSDKKYKEICDLFSADCFSLYRKDKTQRTAAKTLLEVKGMDAIRTAVEYAQAHKGEQYFPQVLTPDGLLKAWPKLVAKVQDHAD